MNNTVMKGLLNAAIFGALLITANLSFAEPIKYWADLTPMQKEALQPLVAQWDTLPSKLQNHLLLSSKQYPKLNPEMKKRFLGRLEKWSKLTPEQREHARQKYLEMRKLPAQEQEKQKRAAFENQSRKNMELSKTQAVTQASQPESSGSVSDNANHQ